MCSTPDVRLCEPARGAPDRVRCYDEDGRVVALFIRRKDNYRG